MKSGLFAEPVIPLKNMMSKPSVLILVFVLTGQCFLATGSAASGTEVEAGKAHPFVQTLADVFVNRTSMTVRISSSADELDLIHGIEPLENGKYDTEELLEGVDIHAEFLLERFEIYDPAGDRLKGKIVEKPTWKIPEEGLDSGRLIDYMLDFTFEYSYDEPPEYLTFQNYIIDYNFALPSEVKLVVKQAGSNFPFADILKIKDPRTFQFDWDQPFDNHLTGDELREWFDNMREKTLGITSWGGVYSFIYITPREVRHEVLIPLANLNEFLNFEQADPWYLEVDEQDEARPQIEALFSEANPVFINGQVVAPRFDRFDFGGLDVRDFGLQRERKRISLANGRVGVIMSYPTRNIPDKVEVTWTMFSKMLKDVDVVQISPGDKVEKKQFSKYLTDNTVTWENEDIPPLPDVVDVKVDLENFREASHSSLWSILAFSMAGLVFVIGLFSKMTANRILLPCILLLGLGIVLVPIPGIDTLQEEDADQVFSTLHTNLFRSFDYNTEEDVYDALAQTIEGPLLKKIYLDMRKSLEVKEQGGAVSNIERIEIMEGEITDATVDDAALDAPDFAYRCIWELEGTVEHWGHIHRRTNRYEALFNVRNIDGLWKFTDFQAINEEQGKVIRSLRKF